MTPAAAAWMAGVALGQRNVADGVIPPWFGARRRQTRRGVALWREDAAATGMVFAVFADDDSGGTSPLDPLCRELGVAGRRSRAAAKRKPLPGCSAFDQPSMVAAADSCRRSPECFKAWVASAYSENSRLRHVEARGTSISGRPG